MNKERDIAKLRELWQSHETDRPKIEVQAQRIKQGEKYIPCYCGCGMVVFPDDPMISFYSAECKQRYWGTHPFPETKKKKTIEELIAQREQEIRNEKLRKVGFLK
jgi:hypothetical protein